MFTDNLVIGYPVQNFHHDKGEPELGYFFNILSYYQMNLAIEGFFARGGIAFGKHYMDNIIVFGDALLEAHNIDESGKPPIIFLSSSVKDLVIKHIDFYSSPESSPQYNDLLQDEYGRYFINYLKVVFDVFPEGGVFFDLLSKHKKIIEYNIEIYKFNDHIRQKYIWLAGYHNFTCDEFANDYPVINNPDQSPEYAFASETAQQVLNYKVKYIGPSPSRISL
jgi:hypothetical protein